MLLVIRYPLLVIRYPLLVIRYQLLVGVASFSLLNRAKARCSK
jgi:hypothetical protein